MLGKWLPHQEYKEKTIINLLPHLNFHKSRVIQMEETILKLLHLDLDKSLPIIKPLYSYTGAPSQEQAGIIRSLILMLDQKKHGLTEWAELVANDRLLYDICGFINRAPAVSSYYDFIDRLWLRSKDAEIKRKKKVRLFQSKPRKKIKTGTETSP